MSDQNPPSLATLFERLESQAQRASRATEMLASLPTAASDPASARLTALARLSRGEFAAGWRELRAARAASIDAAAAAIELPAWDGRLDAASRIVLRKAGGVGEQVLLASCLGQAQLREARLLVECHEVLRPLLERSFPGLDFESDLAPALEDFTARWGGARQAGLLDLAAALRPSHEAFPPRNRYLVPCPRQRRAARAWLDWLGGEFKIGVGCVPPRAGRGNRAGTELNAALMRVCDQLAGLPGVSLVDLITGRPVHPSPRGRGETCMAGAFPAGEALARDLDARAALMAELDLVITPANVNAHLCGAIGGQGWVVVPWLPKWCWMAQGEQTPWYPELRLFRPARPDSWEDVAARLITAVAHLRQRRKPFSGPAKRFQSSSTADKYVR